MKDNYLDDKILPETGLTFDDLLLLPGYTDFKRRDTSLSVMLHKNIKLNLPVMSSPMDTVTELEMAEALAQIGGLGIIHRNLEINNQAKIVSEIKEATVKDIDKASLDSKKRLLVGAAVGAGEDLEKRTESLIKAGVDLIVVDSGHGNSKFIIEATKFIKKKYPSIPVMAGNIATYDGAVNLIEAGADILRVGMGPGSICTTRVITGMGVPQITAVMETLKAALPKNIPVVADGGIRQIGDIAKALAIGAKAVMLGSLLARFEESPGEKVIVNNKSYKTYRGMGSVAAMKKGGAERYGQSIKTEEKKLIAEGVEGLVEYKGSVYDYLYQIDGSLRSSLYYLGSRNLEEFAKKAKFIKISNAGLRESHPHSVVISNTGENYHK